MIQKYEIIYADPPWSYRDRGCNGSAEKHYPTMTLSEICDLSVQKIAADNAVLFIWATYPMIAECLDVIKAWGFRYKTIGFQWVKTTKNGKYFFGLGHWTRGNTEPCLIATRGKIKRINNSVSQLVVSPLRAHSQKPDEVRDRIVTLIGDKPRIELFARGSFPGWATWGNEVPNTIDFREVIKCG